MSLNENAHKNVKNGPKMVNNRLFVKLCKPIAPFKRSGPKIFVVDSEAYTYDVAMQLKTGVGRLKLFYLFLSRFILF